MVSLVGFSLTTLDIILAIITLVGALLGFLVALWYWGLDHRTQTYDEGLRREIADDAAFSGIRTAARPKFIVTSDSQISKLTTLLQKLIGRIQRKPDKIIPIEGDNYEARQIEMIRERIRYIPGKNVLTRNLYDALSNYYAYKLALSRGDITSNVVEHYQSRFEENEFSKKVVEVGKPSNYPAVSLEPEPNSDEARDPLNDVFLKLVDAAEKYCVDPIPAVGDQLEAIERCRDHLMLSFYVLWARRMKGIEVRRNLPEDVCVAAYRTDVRDENNWGYWMLPREKCDTDEFRRLRHIAWNISELLESYWQDLDYSELYPGDGSIIDMEPVDIPFLISLMDETEFRGGGSTSRN